MRHYSFCFFSQVRHQKRFFIAMDVGEFTIVLYKSCTWHYVQHNKYSSHEVDLQSCSIANLEDMHIMGTMAPANTAYFHLDSLRPDLGNGFSRSNKHAKGIHEKNDESVSMLSNYASYLHPLSATLQNFRVCLLVCEARRTFHLLARFSLISVTNGPNAAPTGPNARLFHGITVVTCGLSRIVIPFNLTTYIAVTNT